jgi:AcrR family transcriptional regulator
MPDSATKRGRPTTHDDGVAVRERLLDAAGRLFYADGIRAVGIDRVLREAGAAKASLYAHFAGKGELVAAYLERRSAEARDAISLRLAAAGDDPAARLDAIFDSSLHAAESPEFRGCPFQIATTEGGGLDRKAAAVCVDQSAWLHGLISACVGELAPGAPPALAEAICVLHTGAMAQHSSAAATRALIAARWAMAQLIGSAWETPRAG